MAGQAETVREQVDWPAFLARQDMVWKRVPGEWQEGAFLGNGLLGAMVFQRGEAVTWEIGRSDVYEHWPVPREDFNAVTYARSRLPIGRFLLKPAGKVTGVDWRLDLWNAELTGTITTTRGTIGIRSFVHAEDLAIVAEMTPSAGEQAAAWEWQADQSISPRKHSWKLPPANYGANPDPVTSQAGATTVCLQPMKFGGQYATAWRIVTDGPTRRLLASVAFTPGANTAGEAATRAVDAFAARPFAKAVEAHRTWWHAYYPCHFVSLPDGKVEAFYWTQIYKLGSATRPDRPAMDLLGPWFRPTAWPGYWWNINTQVAYYPVFAANRIDYVEPLLHWIDASKPALAANVGVPGALGLGRATGSDLRCLVELETGNLPWVLHLFWLKWRYTQDEAELRRLFPLLKGSLNYYRFLLKDGPDGKLHLFRTISPEFGDTTDANYDLAWLRWEAQTLLFINGRLAIRDPDAAAWREILARLVAYPTDDRGFRVGTQLSYDRGHHHYSHLAMFYPTYLVNPDMPGERQLLEKSYLNWRSLGHWGEFSRPASIAMCVAMGKTDFIREDLAKLIAECDPNTMLNGKESPVLDGGLGLLTAVNEMLLSSWGDRIRIFPGMPAEWPDASFARMRTEGGFEVAAVRTAGRTRWVAIKSLAGQPCRVRSDLRDVVATVGGQEVPLKTGPDGDVELSLAAGQTAILRSRGQTAAPVVAPVPTLPNTAARFGLP